VSASEILEVVRGAVVGRTREVEVVVAALAAGRNVLLEGPPGTGKSTLLRSVAGALGLDFVFVEGNAELTPARLLGSHDPAHVLAEGYTAEAFVDGPMLEAVRSGSLLYVEEINRIPEETLNVLVTVMSEREVTVPRLGRVEAAEGFRLVAAMNPFDAVGTARISGAIYDRTCRVAMGYQDADEESAIVSAVSADATAALGPEVTAKIVELVRATREHPDIRLGSSVRGAIDMAAVASALGELRGVAGDSDDVTRDAAITALSGRIRLHEGTGRTPDDVIADLWRRFFETRPKKPSDSGESSSGKGAPRRPDHRAPGTD
jgi:MoxR-like ATPase